MNTEKLWKELWKKNQNGVIKEKSLKWSWEVNEELRLSTSQPRWNLSFWTIIVNADIENIFSFQKFKIIIMPLA